MRGIDFHPRRSIEEVEEGNNLAPRFGPNGLLPCITTDHASGDMLMMGWMTADALRLTLNTGERKILAGRGKLCGARGQPRGMHIVWWRHGLTTIKMHLVAGDSGRVRSILPCRLSVMLLPRSPGARFFWRSPKLHGKRKNLRRHRTLW